jgi:hypothetical protein
MSNLLVDKNTDEVIALVDRAGKSGYNGIVLADYKLNLLGDMPRTYFRNVSRVKKAATANGLEVIPAIFPIGYSSGLLRHDPNLAEGLPVKKALFEVKGGEARLIPNSGPVLKNGDLEEVRGDRFLGFSYQDNPGKATFADREVVHHGKVSCRMQDVGQHSPHGHGRLNQAVRVKPNTCYRYSAWIKTRNLQPARGFQLLVLASGQKGSQALTFYEGRLKPTQDWTRVEVIFNSLDHTEVLLYAGLWGGKKGTLWLDELNLEEMGLVNVLRRPGCPLTVASADGKRVYIEGRDFEPIRDPRLGQTPWPGEYTFDHPGASLRLTPSSNIQEGERLHVSWYHPIIIHESQVMCCLSDPKVTDLLRDQVRRVQDLLQPKTILMSHDEIRVAGWCASCQATGKTPGQLLADNLRTCVALIRAVNSQARILVWSDMFDPHHNAVDQYYLVNGTFKGSWEGLPPEVVVVNWNLGKAAESLKWFADRGHAQILAGYYDEDIGNFRRWDTATRAVPRILGFMYTTWQHKFDHLEEYGKAMLGKE